MRILRACVREKQSSNDNAPLRPLYVGHGSVEARRASLEFETPYLPILMYGACQRKATVTLADTPP